LERWRAVIETEAVPVARASEPPAVDGTEWVLLLEEDDVPEPELVDTLARAQAATGADVVTCGVRLDDGTEYLFSGEPGGLGLLANDYGTVSLVRGSLLHEAADARWPLLARLSVGGARIVSVPLPLASGAARPATARSDPAEGLAVAELFERALPESQRHLARLAAGLAAAEQRMPAPVSSLPRRVARRVLRRNR
jgi:hypothetical protein